MNQRIQELAEQARASVPPGLVVEEWIRVYNQKLGELIVRKCAEIADKERPNSLGCGYITKTKGQLIREHFGVEE
jgi:hypothetical protein